MEKLFDILRAVEDIRLAPEALEPDPVDISRPGMAGQQTGKHNSCIQIIIAIYSLFKSINLIKKHSDNAAEIITFALKNFINFYYRRRFCHIHNVYYTYIESLI